MRTGRSLFLTAFAALASACVAEAPPIDVAAQSLGSPGGFDDEYVAENDVDELPPCAGMHLDGADVDVLEVEDSGGLYAVEQDGELICVDDAEGLEEAGVDVELPEIDPGKEQVLDGTPLPARDPPPADGTPLPAGGAGGATGGTLVSDGTPLPADASK